MTTEPEREISLQNLLDAIDALGASFVIDPEHGPDALTDDHRADMLGFLAGNVAMFTAVATSPAGNAEGPQWTHGFLAATGNNASALCTIGGNLLAEASTLDSITPTSMHASLAAQIASLASTFAMFAAAIDDDPGFTTTTAHIKGLHSRVRRQLTDIRGALGAVERDLRKRGFDL